MAAPTIVLFPEGAFGPTNNCVGIGQALQRRGARVVFVIEESFQGTLALQGFEERCMRLKPAPDVPEEPGQFWRDFIRETAPQFRRPTIEQLEGLVLPIWTELVAGAEFVDDRLRAIFAELDPDAIVVDNVVAFPAVITHGCPWVRIVSCNPLEVEDPALPPAFSGYPTRDRTRWDAFRRREQELMGELRRRFGAFVRDRGAPELAPGAFIHPSPACNLTLYPEVLDYQRARPLGPTWHRLESCVRAEGGPYRLPERLRRGDGALVYCSLGSLGSADGLLMERLLDALGHSRHRVIVSLGPQHGALRLGDNMDGAAFLPQPQVLPQVDVVITHGGNNTVTEACHFGKPMVVLPLFWDQHDNAQRVAETGLGVRLDPYTFAEAELIGALDRLAADPRLRSRLVAVRDRLQQDPGTERAAERILGQARRRR
ncbi:MAG TPA: nucleotide disphospho-sugar-binding domain-containing protein [Candidatus Micrarchaeia archaeon]|nr:nucleotide disphospho-sugar-binding domain-containing protein [Candidatus Micrarchaeia archaeon]